MKNLLNLINQACDLELNMARLYTLFAEKIPEDAWLWETLAQEENNHAGLITKASDSFMITGQFPEAILAKNLAELQGTNEQLAELIRIFSAEPPDRLTALKTALKLENSAGEMHFQKAMGSKTDSEFLQIFQKLNAEDIDHARRLREYLDTVA